MPNGLTLRTLPEFAMVPGYTPQLQSFPAKPTMPAKIKVKLSPQIKKLKRLEAKLKALDAQMATLVVGEQVRTRPCRVADRGGWLFMPRFAPRARRSGKAVKNDDSVGDVIVAKKLAGLKAGDLKKSIAARRDSLRQAADDAGVVAVLTWASVGHRRLADDRGERITGLMT